MGSYETSRWVEAPTLKVIVHVTINLKVTFGKDFMAFLKTF